MVQSERPLNFAWRLQPSRCQLCYPLLPAEAAPELAPHLDYRMPRRGEGTLQAQLTLSRPHLHVRTPLFCRHGTALLASFTGRHRNNNRSGLNEQRFEINVVYEAVDLSTRLVQGSAHVGRLVCQHIDDVIVSINTPMNELLRNGVCAELPRSENT